MNKYQSAEQDNRATKYAIETTAALLDFAKAVDNNRATIADRTALKAANKAAAEKTARRLVKIYEKHTAAARETETA